MATLPDFLDTRKFTGPFRLLELNFQNYRDSYLRELVEKASTTVQHDLLSVGKEVHADMAGYSMTMTAPSFEDCLSLIGRMSKALSDGSAHEDEGGQFFVGFSSTYTDAQALHRAFQAFIIAWQMACPTRTLKFLVVRHERLQDLLDKLPGYLEYELYCIHTSTSLESLQQLG